MSMRGSALAAFLLGMPLVAGCGPEFVQVSGKVTYEGKPVVSGHLTMIGSDGVARNSEIGLDGSYAIEGVPAGPVKVGVSSPNPYRFDTAAGRAREKMLGGEGAVAGTSTPKPPRGAWFPLPEELQDATRSNLTREVTGETLDIELSASQ